MTRLVLLCTLAAFVSACSTTKVEKPPICDGKHRRPANLYGSVLTPSAPQVQGADAPTGIAPAEPKAVSALAGPQGSCA